MDQNSRIAAIRAHITNLGTYSREDELRLLDVVEAIIGERKSAAAIRDGDEALSDTERVEKQRAEREASAARARAPEN